MDFDALRRRYLELKGEYEAHKIDEATFQKAVDGLQAQDEWGRYWMLGAQSGEWYYHNGQEWVQADPAEAYKLPYVDDEGRYWMIGAQSGRWYYYDGEAWVLPDAPASAAAGGPRAAAAGESTQYYQDDAGRYWALGAQSGEWYFYDEDGWHRAADLPGQPAPASPSAAPSAPQPAVQPHAAGPAGYSPGAGVGQPASGPAPAPYPQPQQAYQPAQPYPSPAPPPSTVVDAGPGAPQESTAAEGMSPAPAQQQVPPEEKPQSGAWYYFDGQHWLRYEGMPEAGEMAGEGKAPDEAAAFEDEFDEDLEEVDVDLDFEEGMQVIEVSAEDIVEVEAEVVEAEVQVEVLKPGQELAPVDEAMAPTRPLAPVRPATVSLGDAEPVTAQRAVQAEAEAQPARRAARPRVRRGRSMRTMPGLLWTVVGGVAVLVLAFLVIVGARIALDSQSRRQAEVFAQPTPTLDAGPPPSTPTAAPTPVPTATPPPTPTPVPLASYRNPGLGFALDYPEGWLTREGDSSVVMGPSARALDIDNIQGAMLWISLTADGSPAIPTLLAEGLARLPSTAETLTEGTVSIGETPWTSAQVRFFVPSLDTDAIASLAVTRREGRGYTIMAIAPADVWNDFSPLFQSAIDSFQFVEVVAAAGGEGAGATPTVTATATLEPTQEPVVYTVQSGDTLLAIAIRFDVSVDDIMAANGLTDPGRLQIGQELVIPVGGQAVAAAATPTAAATAAGTPAPTGAAPEAAATAAPQPATPAPTPTPEPPAEAPLSGRIAYPAWSADIDSYNIWVSDLSGAEQTIIVGNASQPAFSRDGSLFAYRSWDLSQRGIHFVDFVGGRRGRMTSFVEDGLPTWAPDGGTVAFVSRREGDRVPRVYRVGQLGGDDHGLGFQSQYVDTLPDGRLVLKGCSISGDCGLWVMLPEGGGETKIASEGSDTAPAANPVTGKIAFMSFNRGGAGNWEVWTMNNDGSDVRRLTNDPANDGLPTWSPDGQTIAFVSDRGGVWAVWAMNADGSNQRKLFNMRGSPEGVVLHDEANSFGWLEERISWAP